GHNETIIVILTLDPFTEREGMVFFDMAALGLPEDDAFEARDLLGGEVYTWSREAFVRLHPHHTAAHIVSVRPIGGRSWLTYDPCPPTFSIGSPRAATTHRMTCSELTGVTAASSCEPCATSPRA